MADKFQYVYVDPSTGDAVSTPFNTYEGDVTFESESIATTKWIARRLGHPVTQLEFGSGSIYSMIEEAVSEYSTQINNYNMKNWLWEQYGAETTVTGSTLSSTGSNNAVNPHLGASVYLSEQYGEVVGVGGNATLHSGSVTLTKDQQDYSLKNADLSEALGTNDKIIVQKVFHYGPSAITKFYDPLAGAYDQQVMTDTFGFGNVSPAVSFILRPVSHDITRAQSIETSDKIRKSAYSFEIVNDQLKLFPRPTDDDVGEKVWFEYYLRNDVTDTSKNYLSKKVSGPNNAPYRFLKYEEINSTGRQWIRKYALALSKELLGIIRSKYSSLPIPNGDVTLDGDSLKTEGREEKSQLLEELKEFLEAITLKEKALAEQEIANAQQEVLNKAPLKIYIG